MRSVADIQTFFSNLRVGTAETGAALAWPIIHQACPQVRQIVIRRDVEEATFAMADTYYRAGIPFDPKKLTSVFQRSDRALDKISSLPGTLTLPYEDLSTEAGCKRIFEFCLSQPFDHQWWQSLKNKHIEADLRAVVSYYIANHQGIENFKRLCKHELIRLVRSGEVRHAVH